MSLCAVCRVAFGVRRVAFVVWRVLFVGRKCSLVVVGCVFSVV